jgi:hypothetical protein
MRSPDDAPESKDPVAELERAFIDEFLERSGHTVASVRALPETEREQVMAAASRYASGRLAEVEARAHLVSDLHHNE